MGDAATVANFLRKTCNRAIQFLLAALIALPMQAAMPYIASAAETGTWVDGDMPQLTLGDQLSTGQAFPSNCTPQTWNYHSYTKPNGQYDPIGRQVPINICVVQAGFGEYGSSGDTYIKPNTAIAFPTAYSIVPNPSTPGFAYTPPTPSSGFSHIALFNSLGSAGKFAEDTFSKRLVYTLNPVTEDKYLHTSGGARIVVRGGISYSSNGAWLVTYSSNAGYIRVNTATGEVLRFDTTSLNFGLGFIPNIQLAISDDGNTVVLSGQGQWAQAARVYDLTGCTVPTYPIQGSVASAFGCKNRYLYSKFNQSYAGFRGIFNMRFSTDGKSVRGTVETFTNNTSKYYRGTMHVAGYELPPPVTYLALGDSFSSGEGAYHYLDGTDEPENKCHLSVFSYPYLAASSVGIDPEEFHSVACSGAKHDPEYHQTPQYRALPDNAFTQEWFPGSKTQKSFVEQANADVATISMIGNDIGFKDKIVRCLALDSCFHFREDRQSIVNEINAQFSDLLSMYNSIKRNSKEGARIYVLGYPQLFGVTGNCRFGAGLDAEERETASHLVSYLNGVIKAATEQAGVQYIDVENAFEHNLLCSNSSIEEAANGLTQGNDILGVIGNESFHPNALGHQLFAQALLEQSNNFTKPMSASRPLTLTDEVADEYADFVDGAPTGGVIKRGIYVEGDNATGVLRGANLSFIAPATLPVGAVFDAIFNSEPTYAGTLIVDQNGQLAGNVTVPETLEPGIHTLHLYGKDYDGADMDLYHTFYVAASAEDFDGDGTLNENEECLVAEPAGVDEDRDDIDDACDPEIGEPPADSAPPEVVGTLDREPNVGGWYNGDVTISWTATDPEPSSGAPTQPAPTIAGQEGVHSYTSEPSCDPLNNCASGSLEIRIDKTAPDIEYTLSTQPNANGWHTDSVTVTFGCSDATSGVASCSAPQTVNGTDGMYVVTGEVTDTAGNVNSVNVLVSLDGTAPTVTQSVSPNPNIFNWHNTDVTVESLCDDNLSGILECSPSTTLSVEGANQVVESVAQDNAGNTAAVSTSVNIDKTPPVLSAPSWINSPKSTLGTATVTVSVTDNLSGIAEAEYYLGDDDPGQGNGAAMQVSDNDVSVSFNTDFPTGVYKVTMRAKDKAGNWSASVADYLVVYDPFGARMTGKRALIPSLTGGDALPGLIATNQEDKAKFGFNVRYDKQTGEIHRNSDFQFAYETGTNCKKPAKAQNCHTLELNATSIAWLTTQGQNNSTGIFQGTASLEVDGAQSNVLFLLTGLDGELLDAISGDRLALKIYPEGSNPNIDSPLYQVDAEVLRGNIKIRKW